MTWQSRVPAVLDALVALWGGTPGLVGLVQDGPLPLEGANLEVLAVGHDGSDEGGSTEGALTPEGFRQPDREQFSAVCLIAVVNGAGDLRAARIRAFELLGLAAEALGGDRTLGGIVLRAHVRDVALSQLQDDGGAQARLAFAVACDAYTVR